MLTVHCAQALSDLHLTKDILAVSTLIRTFCTDTGFD